MAGIWTRNYFNILTAMFLGDTTITSTSTPTDYDAPIRIRKPDGTYTSISTDSLETHIGTNTNSTRKVIGNIMLNKANMILTTNENGGVTYGSNIYIGVGQGTSPAAYDDYKLGNIITNGLTLASNTGTLTQASTYDAVTHHYSSERVYTITNSSASPIAVSEIGIYTCPVHYSNSYDRPLILVYHDVFNTETLNIGESLVITMKRDGEVYNYTPY